MKEVAKNDVPEVSGGYVGPFVTDPTFPTPPDYPQGPIDIAGGDVPGAAGGKP